LTRLEDPDTGKIDDAFQVEIPKKDRIQAGEAARFLGSLVADEVPHHFAKDASEDISKKNISSFHLSKEQVQFPKTLQSFF